MVVARVVFVGLSLLVSVLAAEATAGELCGFAQVSAGENHTCGVRTGGTVECWGNIRIPGFPACGGDTDDALLLIGGLEGFPAGASAPDLRAKWTPAVNYLRRRGWTQQIRPVVYYEGTVDDFFQPSEGVFPMHLNEGPPSVNCPHRCWNSPDDEDCTETDNDHHREDACQEPLAHTRNTSIEHLAFHLAWGIYNDHNSRGRNVRILAHSMGGLIVRLALLRTQQGTPMFPPRLFVSDVVTLGTPHGGADAAARCFACPKQKQVDELQPGSAILRALDGDVLNPNPPTGNNLREGRYPQGARGTEWTVIGSENDRWVSLTSALDLDAEVKVTYERGANVDHDGYLNPTRQGRNFTNARIERYCARFRRVNPPKPEGPGDCEVPDSRPSSDRRRPVDVGPPLSVAWEALRVSRAAVEDQTLTVMTYNVRKASHDKFNSNRQWGNRKQHTMALVRAEYPDVLGTQEPDWDQLQTMAKALPDYEWVGVNRWNGERGPACEGGDLYCFAPAEFAAIFYRRDRLSRDLTDTGPRGDNTFWFSDDPETPGGGQGFDAKHRRICTWARFEDQVTQKHFYVYNVHLPTDGRKSEVCYPWCGAKPTKGCLSRCARLRSLILLCDKIRAREHPEDPVIVLGDFNAGVHEKNQFGSLTHEYRYLEDDILCPELQLSDSYVRLLPNDTQMATSGVWNGLNPSWDKIDWILVTPSTVVRWVGIQRLKRGRVWPSDHFPVLAGLELPD